MSYAWLMTSALLLLTAFAAPPTFCNPLNLPYRFQLEAPSRREAADPTVVKFHGEWWLFASKSGGYWHTRDFATWRFVEPTGLPLENYAPAVEQIGGRLYFCAGGGGVYSTDDPAAGRWEKVAEIHGAADTDLFRDDDGRVYLYYGCSDHEPIHGEEVDPQHGFMSLGKVVDLISGRPAEHGWEAKREPETMGTVAEDSQPDRAPWIEGSWMTKANGRYYLQYAAPGTELKGYGDGVYVSNRPLGPFVYQPSNPFSYHPTGFAPGAGHGSTFRDGRGNLWHVATITIARRHMFERRLGMFPAKVFPDGQLACNTYLGDYPQYLPGTIANPFGNNSPGWMLLSLNKPVAASSTLAGFPASLAVDESIASWWSAASGDAGEWFSVDLGVRSRIHAIQVNFADEGATALGRLKNDAYRYRLEVSSDGRNWQTLADKSRNESDAPHDYVVLPSPVRGRYVRIVNLHTPAGAKFSLSGLRVFGRAPGHAPSRVDQVRIRVVSRDTRHAQISWSATRGAEFYIVRYGIRPDRLFSNYQIYGATSLDLDVLNSGVKYYFAVDAVNAAGIAKGTAIDATRNAIASASARPRV